MRATETRITDCISHLTEAMSDEYGLHMSISMGLCARGSSFAYPFFARMVKEHYVDGYQAALSGFGLCDVPEAREKVWAACKSLALDAIHSRPAAGCFDPAVAAERLESEFLHINLEELGHIQRLTREAEAREVARSGNKRVAMVFGRDMAAKNCADAIVRAAGLEPFDFMAAKAERAESGHEFNHEIIEDLFEMAAIAVVVLTPEEQVELRRPFRNPTALEDAQVRYQPRSNVILELGIALGAFGRRVVVLEFSASQHPSDLFGLHPIRFGGDLEEMAKVVYRKLENLDLPIQEFDPRPLAGLSYRAIPTAEDYAELEVPFAGVSGEDLPEFEMGDEAFEADEQVRKYKELGYEFQGQAESRLSISFANGYNHVVWKSPTGKLYKLIGRRDPFGTTVWMCKPPPSTC